MAHGEVVHTAPADLPYGAALTSSGRVSRVHLTGDANTDLPPFGRDELIRLDETLSAAIRSTNIRFTAYVGDIGTEGARGLKDIFAAAPSADESVLIAVSPNAHTVDVVAGSAVSDRATEEVCKLGVTAAVSEFRAGNLVDGIVSAIRVMSAAIQSP
ncbi:DUF5130 family protein [Millisia brevis]|uniref:DUF5130 family protein n=1 Tax=Millisia brevis TaxID=264148 RepID=UPI000829AAED|nr:DUF5130 family protein [Millisia brevis]